MPLTWNWRLRRLMHGRISPSVCLSLTIIIVFLTVNYFWFRAITKFDHHIKNMKVNEGVENNPPQLPSAPTKGLLKEEERKKDQGKEKESLQPVPVYVVEEHHEVIPFWFGAVEGGVLPGPSGITLIHMDAHSDSSFPDISEDFPMFRFPIISEWPRYMTSNDEFIIAAAITGMFSRFIWVWPQWTNQSVLDLFGAESISVETVGGIWTHKSAMLQAPKYRFCMCGKLLNPPEEGNIFLKIRHCFRFKGEINIKQPISIPQSQCLSKMKIRIDIKSENKMVEEMLPGGSLDFTGRSLSNGFILDIDEDYFGCEAAVLPLYKVGLEPDFIDHLTYELGRGLFCGTTANEEFVANSIFRSILQFSKDNPKDCKILQEDENVVASKTCASQLYSFLQASPFPTVDGRGEMKLDDVLCKNNASDTISILQKLLTAIAPVSDAQNQAISDIGICFIISPETYTPDPYGVFRICDGNNRPSSTAVQFHTPDDKDIDLRTKKLQTIVNQLPSAPHIVTISRSVRDGYTPRSKFHQIETNILNILNNAFQKKGVSIKYHKNLLGGEDGWRTRLNN